MSQVLESDDDGCMNANFCASQRIRGASFYEVFHYSIFLLLSSHLVTPCQTCCTEHIVHLSRTRLLKITLHSRLCYEGQRKGWVERKFLKYPWRIEHPHWLFEIYGLWLLNVLLRTSIPCIGRTRRSCTSIRRTGLLHKLPTHQLICHLLYHLRKSPGFLQ